MRRWALMLMAGLTCGAGASLPAADVGLIKINGAIGPATASYIARAIDVAAARDDACLIIQLDTPGGSLDSTKDIVPEVLRIEGAHGGLCRPGACPGGQRGRASSRWPRTSPPWPLTPASARRTRFPSAWAARSRRPSDVMKKKLRRMTPPASSRPSPRSAVATSSGPGPPWSKATSITAEKALELKVIDLIAKDVPDLLDQLDGREVNGKTLHTAKATVVEIPMTFRETLPPHCSRGPR